MSKVYIVVLVAAGVLTWFKTADLDKACEATNGKGGRILKIEARAGCAYDPRYDGMSGVYLGSTCDQVVEEVDVSTVNCKYVAPAPHWEEEVPDRYGVLGGSVVFGGVMYSSTMTLREGTITTSKLGGK